MGRFSFQSANKSWKYVISAKVRSMTDAEIESVKSNNVWLSCQQNSDMFSLRIYKSNTKSLFKTISISISTKN